MILVLKILGCYRLKDWMMLVLKILGCYRLKDWMMLVYVCFILSRNAEFLLIESFLVCNVCWIDEHNNTNCLVHLSTSPQTLQTAMKTHLQFFFSFSFLLIYFRLMPSSAMTDDPSHITVFVFKSFFTPPPVWLSCESKNFLEDQWQCMHFYLRVWILQSWM